MTESSKKMPVAGPRRRDDGRRPVGRALVAMLVAVLALAILPSTATAATVESRTTHVRLGFTSTFPINDGMKEGVAGVDYEFSATGTATLAVALGADITVAYDRKDLVPGGTVPVDVTFTPTDDPGPEFDLDVRADLVADVDVSAGTYVAACVPGSPLNPLCPLLATLDTVDERVAGFQLAGVTGDFVAPLGADAPVVLNGTGDGATLRFAGLDLLGARMAANVTVGPVGPGAVPGLGGAVTVARSTGAALVGGETPAVDVLGWFAGGSTQTLKLELPASPGASAGVDLSPIFHWLQMSANVSVDLDFKGDFDVLPDPGAIEVFSGSLGKVFVDNGVDVQIGNAVKSTIGLDPGFAAQVQAGNLPVALTDPPIAVIQPPPSSLPALGRVSFTIDLDADDDGLLDGEEIARGLDPTTPTPTTTG